MDMAVNPKLASKTEIEVRGVRILFDPSSQLPKDQSLQSYAISRMPIANGRFDLISHKDLTVVLSPRSDSKADTFISPGVEVGTGVYIGAHSFIGQGAVLGPRSRVGRGCEIGENTRVGLDVEIGDNNIIPSFSEISNGVKIPNGTFTSRLKGLRHKSMAPVITQRYVDETVAMTRTMGIYKFFTS